jgi:FkbM family methyltransferase
MNVAGPESWSNRSRKLAALYSRLRPRDIAVPTLIGRERGECDFYLVERLHGLSTIIEQHAQRAKTFGTSYRPLRLPVVTLANLCETHGLNGIDFLTIDVEGAEADVLFGGEWDRFRPKVIVAEAVTPGTGEPAWHDWEPRLLAQGYRFALFDTLNRFYVAQEHPEIMMRLPSERAPGMRYATCTKLGARRTVRGTSITRWRANLRSVSGRCCRIWIHPRRTSAGARGTFRHGRDRRLPCLTRPDCLQLRRRAAPGVRGRRRNGLALIDGIVVMLIGIPQLPRGDRRVR